MLWRDACQAQYLGGFSMGATKVKPNPNAAEHAATVTPAQKRAKKELPPLPRRCYSVTETAAMVGVHPDTVRKEINRGNILKIRLADRILIPASEVDRL
jgi:excisionase family DNA binding protein